MLQTIKWKIGPALSGVEEWEMECGDSFLVAVRVCDAKNDSNSWWEFAVVTATEHGFEVDGEYWGWCWEDVYWFIPVKDLYNLPVSI